MNNGCKDNQTYLNMQEKNEKKSNFFERILQLIDFYQIKNVKSFACEHLGYASMEKINRLQKEGTSPSYDILVDISNKFDDISPEWLLTGKGEMLKSGEKPVIIPAETYGKTSPGTKAVHLYDVSAAAGYGNFDEIISNEKIIDTFIVPTFKDISWLIFVKGSSMYPKYSSGDIIACRVLYESRFIQWGKVHVVATREQGMLVKRLKESDRQDCIKAISDNPEYDSFDIPKDEILGIALVIGVIRME